MKLIGAVVFIISSGAYGIYSGQKIERSLEQAKDLRVGLSSLKQEIYLNGFPLGKAMENASVFMSTDVKEMFSDCGKAVSVNNGTSLQEHMLSYINEPEILLDDQCKAILLRWASNAGIGDRSAEIENLEYAVSQLEQLITVTEEECNKKARMYKNCGFLLGAFVVAVLL